MSSWVKAPYSYACNTYCTNRWGPPADEVKPAPCENCQARLKISEMKKAELNRKQAQRYWQRVKSERSRESMKELREQRKKGEKSKRKLGRPRKHKVEELDETTNLLDLL